MNPIDLQAPDLAQLGTIAGLSAATVIVVWVVRQIVTLTDRQTCGLVVAVAETLSVLTAFSGGYPQPVLWLLVVLNGIYAAAGAIGFHQGAKILTGNKGGA